MNRKKILRLLTLIAIYFIASWAYGWLKHWTGESMEKIIFILMCFIFWFRRKEVYLHSNKETASDRRTSSHHTSSPVAKDAYRDIDGERESQASRD